MSDGESYKRRAVSLETLRSKQLQKNTLRWIFYVIVFLIVCGVFAAVCFGIFFRVSAIDLSGVTHYTYEEICEKLPVSIGDNMYSFKATELESELRADLPYVAEITVSRKLPSTVTITVVEKEPVMYMKVIDSYYLISDTLNVLERTDTAPDPADGLTEFTTGKLSRCIVGETLRFTDNSTSEAFLSLCRAIENNDLDGKITAISLKSRFDITMTYENRIDVYIGDTSDSDMKMRFLIGIMKQLDENDSGYLDLTDTKEASFRPD
ncbi:MAG TPA: FtsQ-type POTRA domain-containing protein [Bacillota bacterium]|nr:FtsQ-type POTRA domain-containing protein [Bacillota bacterium]